MSSDKIVIEIDRDLYRLCMLCVAVMILPVFLLIILPWMGMLLGPINILVLWPLVVIVILYCISRLDNEATIGIDSVMDSTESASE